MSNGYQQQQQRGNGQQLAECGRRRRGGSDGPVCRGADPRVPAAHTVNAVRKHHFRTLNLFIKMNTIFVCFFFFVWLLLLLGSLARWVFAPVDIWCAALNVVARNTTRKNGQPVFPFRTERSLKI